MTPTGIVNRFGAIASLAHRAYYPYRMEIALLAALSFLAGILEGIGINAVIPLLSYIVDVNGPSTDVLTNIMRSLFEFMRIDFAPKFLLFFIVAMFIARAVVMFFVSYMQARIVGDYSRETKGSLFESVLRASWPHIMKQRLGHLETILMTDVPASESMLRHLANAITLATGIIVYLVVAFTISPVTTGATLLLGLLVVFGSRPFMGRIRALGRERVRLNQETTHLMSEHILGMKSVKAAGIEPVLIARGKTLFAEFRDVYVRLTVTQQMILLIIPPLGVLYIALIFGIAFRTNYLSMAALPAIVYLIYRIFQYVQQIQESIQRVNDLLPHLQSVLTFRDSSLAAGETTAGTKPFVFTREFSFKDVRYAYDQTQILKGLNFSIEKGTMVGIIGPSGAGKTTCVDLLLRLLEADGSVTLDGVDVREISLAEWRRKTAYVSQDIFLVHDTIENNIRFYDPSVTDEDIARAIRMAHVEEFLTDERTLGSMIGERGFKLSAGQRQRIAIARALARKPEILILDEATSALDAESEQHIKRILEELKGTVTIVMVAHRLTTLTGADKIVVIDGGKIVEEGSPAVLLKDTSSYFHKVNTLD